MQGTGRELRVILEFLRRGYPERFIITQIVKDVKMDRAKVVHLTTYAIEKGWVELIGKDEKLGPYKLRSDGIDKLNNWTNKDDQLII